MIIPSSTWAAIMVQVQPTVAIVWRVLSCLSSTGFKWPSGPLRDGWSVTAPATIALMNWLVWDELTDRNRSAPVGLAIMPWDSWCSFALKSSWACWASAWVATMAAPFTCIDPLLMPVPPRLDGCTSIKVGKIVWVQHAPSWVKISWMDCHFNR